MNLPLLRRLSAMGVAALLAMQAMLTHPLQALAASPVCECIPSTAAVEAGFDLAGVGRLGPNFPHLPRIGVDSAIVPPALLKATGWVESNWSQFSQQNIPLLSADFGYGIMQITSGMAGAFGDPLGSLPLATQARIGGDYIYNIAYGARLLAQEFNTTPAINNHDPTALEDWYYALWAYNGWGWVNNPNNPRFTRQGTPATDPASFPYQERVYYWIRHPPLGESGRPLWPAMHVTLPSNELIGDSPGIIHIKHVHREIPHVYSATYDMPLGLTAMHAGSSLPVHVRVFNASGLPWTPRGGPAFGLMYHWVRFGHHTGTRYDPNLHGIDVLDGQPTPLRRAVSIGGSVRVSVMLQAPATPGHYVLEWDMWGRKPGWFSYNSVPPGMQNIRVAPAGADVPPYIDPPAAPTLQGDHAWLVAMLSGRQSVTVDPGAPYSETLLVFNPGGLAWGRGYRVQPQNGSAGVRLPLKFVAPCRTVPITIHGAAPATPGAYRIIWRLVAPSGQPFGPIFPIQLTVIKTATPSARFVNRLI